ncbi:hypothetical protein EV368DRAFT_67896 [Lentinula lateritia]|nr:hypothetical protein EV368DRAFT_67896 [Lentinula lateritia]
MSSDSACSPFRTPSPLLPPFTALGKVPSPDSESDGEVEQDQLAFILESPSRPQLQLFETVFNTGKPLSGYCQDNPLWLLLAEVASPCTNCVKTPGKCKVLPNSPRCTNCTSKKTCSLGKILRYRYFARRCNQDLAYSRRFLELHGTPAHQSTWGIPLTAWHEYDTALHTRTSSTSTLLELNMLDERDTVEADQQELREFLALQQGEAAVAAKPVAEAHSGLVQQAGSSSPARTPIKGAGQDLLSSKMPSIPRSTLVPRNLASHPYRAENQCLAARAEYRRIIDQFNTLDRALSGPSDQSLPERFQKVEEELGLAKKDWDDAAGKLSTSSRRVSELTTALLYQHGITDEANALSTRQRARLEELQEEVHRTHGRAAFVERMIKEYPNEGYYEVVLPPLSQLEGDLVKVRADLRRVATLAHRLYRSDPATVLHHHNRYIGAIIEAVVAFLRRTLDSEDPDIVAHNFRLALDYMQSARGVHGDLHMWSISSIQWFFNNAVDQDEGLYTLMLENSRFDSDGPFLTAAQHAGFANPPPGSLEPPLHRRMLALSTALPHREGTGRWDDLVPAIPSDDQLTLDWEQLMLRYIHHITDTPLSAPDVATSMSLVGPGVTHPQRDKES